MSAKHEKKKAPECEQPENQPDIQEEQAREECVAQPEVTGPGAAQPPCDEQETLKEQLAQCSETLMRTLAEYDNYRKRSQRERAEIYPDAVATTVTKLLPVLDNFERAMQAPCADAEFKKGVDMIFTAFRDCMKGLHVEEIPAQGEQFDPNFHNAVMHTEDEALGENVVAQVLQKGYRIGDKVLRHAMVQVAN